MFFKSRRKKAEYSQLLENMTNKRTLWGDVLSRLLRNKIGMLGLAIVSLLLILIVFAPVFTSYDYAEQSFPERFLYPSGQHLFGTDDFGRDLWTRILYGGRNSLLIAFVATLLAAIVGVVIGSSAGFFGNKTDLIISRILDIIMAIPSLLLAIAISAALGSGPVNTSLAISISGIAPAARIMRSTVMSIKTNEYIEAAKATGSRDYRIIFRHILPNTIAPLIINSTLSIGACITAISGLSFIGLGVQPPFF